MAFVRRQRIVVDVLIAAIAIAAALAFLFIPRGQVRVASACSYPGAPDCDMNPPPPPPGGGGGHNGGGGNSCSCVNGVCSGNACPKSNPPPPPPPPPAGNFAPPPPPNRTRTPVPPPPPAGNFAPNLPVTPTQTPTAVVGADPPRADVAPTPVPDGKLIADTKPDKGANTAGQAAGAAAAAGGVALAAASAAPKRDKPHQSKGCYGWILSRDEIPPPGYPAPPAG